jgi:predicted nucleic acid-binding Zn ribbon protein
VWAYADSQSERAASGPSVPDVLASSQPCVCGTAMSGRQTTACSDRCRAAKSRRARVPLLVREVREIRARSTTILERAWEIKATLERYGSR